MLVSIAIFYENVGNNEGNKSSAASLALKEILSGGAINSNGIDVARRE